MASRLEGNRRWSRIPYTARARTPGGPRMRPVTFVMAFALRHRGARRRVEAGSARRAAGAKTRARRPIAPPQRRRPARRAKRLRCGDSGTASRPSATRPPLFAPSPRSPNEPPAPQDGGAKVGRVRHGWEGGRGPRRVPADGPGSVDGGGQVGRRTGRGGRGPGRAPGGGARLAVRRAHPRLVRLASPLLPVPTVGGSGFVVELVRRDWVRRRLALAGASVTLALGVLAAALHLDERWQLRPGRFWCRSPRELDVRLGFWAGRRPEPTRSTGAAARGGKRTKRRKPKKG